MPFLQQIAARFVLWLHQVVRFACFIFNIVLYVLLVMFKLLIKKNTLLELFGVLEEQGMMGYIGEGDPFLRVNHEQLSEKVFNVLVHFFQLLFLRYDRLQVENGVASAEDIGFHVVA